MTTQVENRTHRRFPLLLSTDLRTSGENEAIHSETLDVSASGVLFRVKEPLAVGQPVNFLLKFGPDLTMTTPALLVKFWGTVVRAETRPDTIEFRHSAAVKIQRYEFVTSAS